MMYEVYALCDPDSNAIKYIGISKNCPTRIQHHLSNAVFETTDKSIWIRSLKEQGKSPKIKMLAIGLTKQTALKIETDEINSHNPEFNKNKKRP